MDARSDKAASMISPITRNARKRRIIVYDMEWIPGTLELRLIGVYDGKEYRTYSKPLEFLEKELTSETDGAWYYAHAGGLADFQFLLQELVDRGYEVKAAFSGSSAIIVEVQRGGCTWMLIDSYWLLRSPLKKIGEAVGIPKLRDYLCPGSSMIDTAIGKMCDGKGCSHPPQQEPGDPICIFYAPMGELRTYNEQDNVILWTAITKFQDEILSLDGELCMTQASTAMRLYRRSHLDRVIKTNATINKCAREAYVGSRVEPYAPLWTPENDNEIEDLQSLYYYDVNSSFPYAMTFPAPGSVRAAGKRLPTKESELWMADVEVEVPDMYMPPLPYRHPKEKRVYFPTGAWRSWYSGIDIRLLESVGGKVTRVHRVIEFDGHETLASYARDLYARRLKSTTEFEKMLYKLLLNSLYGKFGENPIKIAAFFNPTDTDGMAMLMPGVFLGTQELEIEHEHVPVAMHITSFARRTLYQYNSKCLDARWESRSGRSMRGRIFYNDTDSAITNVPPRILSQAAPLYDLDGVIGKELGKLKWEYEIRGSCVMPAPKIYMLEGAINIEKRDKYMEKDGLTLEQAEQKASGSILRAKGFSRMTVDRFKEILEGKEVEVRRMTRVRELLRKGVLTPSEGIVKKRLQFQTRAKRCAVEGNDTRPWTLEELSETLKREDAA